jgi:hypothetical protein
MPVPSPRVTALVLLAGTGVTACSDSSLKATNASPEAAITSHANGDTVPEGIVTAFRGRAGDPDDTKSSLLAAWFANGVELCAAAAPQDDGTTVCEATLPAGTVSLSLEVTDPSGGAASASVSLEVTPTGAPTVDIQEPSADGRYASDRLVFFRAAVGDAEDGPEDMTYTLSSSRDGDLSAQLAPDSGGSVSGYLSLSEGEHALTLRATDTTGKVGTDSVIVDVGEPNTAPDCAIAAPTDASVLAYGTSVLLDGTTTDAQDATSTLVATWTSDRDGLIATLTPTTDGRVAVGTSTLSAGIHALTFGVTDPGGETCSRAVVVKIDHPPEVAILAPADGDVVGDGQEMRFEVEVSDIEDRAEDLDLVWESDRDGVFSMAGADGSGTATILVDDLSVGEHLVTVAATDRDGLSSTATVVITVNGLPTAPTVTIVPAVPDTTDALVATVTAASVDPEGDPLTYRYDWYVNGVPSAATTTNTLPASATTRDEVWSVVVTPNDGISDGATGTASVTIDNTAPVLLATTLTPTSASVTDTLTCTPGTATDDDGDAITYRYAWTVNGAPAASTASTLAAPDFERGDLVRCTATPDDGTDMGLAVASNTVSIGNATPSLTSASISPSTVYTGDTLTCSASGWSDADGDADASTYAWTVNGVAAGTGRTLSTSLVRGDTVVCAVTPYDGTASGSPVSASVVVSNQAPTVASATITPSTARTDDTLTASATTTDADGDPVTLTWAWTVNGVSAGTGTTLPGTAFSKGDVVVATATPSDGATSGATASATVTIANTAPGTPTITISPSAPEAGADDLVCTIATVATDADADRVTYAFSWSLDGAAWTGSTSTTTWSGDTIPGALTEDGDTWTCSVRAYDSTDYGSAVTASAYPEDAWDGARTFSNCGQTGYTGPSQAQCDSSYASTVLAGEVVVSSGIQRWTVPVDGTYQITATGARGAAAQSGRLGGKGARMQGTFSLLAGDVLYILVGQQGTGQSSGSNGGGGGGSFVVRSGTTALLVAGGGGGTRGGASQDGCDATTSTSATTGSGGSSSHSCSARSSGAGYGGIVSSSSWGAGGGGMLGDGAVDGSGWGSMGGKAFTAGGQGGMATTACGEAAHGGFGGGGTGNGCYGGGGGGGYTGGDGGWIAGGGGSYNAGSSQVNTAGVGTAHGSVVIDKL